MAIIALIMAIALPSVMSYFRVSINSAVREMASTIKETYNSAVVTGKVHRLVYDFKEKDYWVESGPATALLDTKESREKEERKRRFSKLSDAPPPSPFGMESSVTRRKIKLPAGVTFEDVLTMQSKDPITEGTAYTHFFPHGMTEQTIVHLMDESHHHVSLVISPIVGTTDVYDRYVSGDEAFVVK